MKRAIKLVLILIFIFPFISYSQKNVGIGTTSPHTTLDIAGSIAWREGNALSLNNGGNSDIALGDNSFFRIIGPTAAFSITGLQGGNDGRIVTLYNTTSFAMTIVNNAISTAVNRILTLTGADIITPSGPNILHLQYNTTEQRWIVIGGQNIVAASSGGGSCTLPGAAGNINGTATVCQGQNNVVYSVASITNAAGYIWNLPTGCSIVSGNNTNSIIVNFSASAASGNITVKGTNLCGDGVQSSYSVTVNSYTTPTPAAYNGKMTFSYTGANQTFTVPSNDCYTTIYVKMWGAGGGGGRSSGGAGAFVSGYLTVSPGTTYTIIVGGGGICDRMTSIAGGFGGGGDAGCSSCSSSYCVASGGGRSAILLTPGSSSDIVTAGGGGGGGGYKNAQFPFGGGGGAPNGFNGNQANNAGGGGAGANNTTGSGSGLLQLGSAGVVNKYGGGGGGGGYMGGAGGQGGSSTTVPIGGGGGGSSYTANLTGAINIAGPYGNDTAQNPAPNNSDSDYVTGVGVGGVGVSGVANSPCDANSGGGNGLIIIYW